MFLSVSAAATEIRKIVHPDGRIEYTNVTPKTRDIRGGSQRDETVYKYRSENGRLAFSNKRPPLHIRDVEVIKFACYACRAETKVNWQTTPLNLTAYQLEVELAAQAYGVDEALVRAVIHAESAFRTDALSKVGAQGLMQLMPSTADDLGVRDSYNAAENIDAGTRYLAALLERYQGDTLLATAAYNAGPGAVTRHNGVPPYPETQRYVKRVAILQKRYQHALLQRAQ